MSAHLAHRLHEGRQLAQTGMQRTLDLEPDTWLDGALEALRRFVAIPGWHSFKLEDFRAWYLDSGRKPPHDHHVWGAFANRAVKANVIRFTGRHAPSVSPRTHAHWVKVWEKV